MGWRSAGQRASNPAPSLAAAAAAPDPFDFDAAGGDAAGGSVGDAAGSEAVADDDAASVLVPQPEAFLVKWRHAAPIHSSWATEAALLQLGSQHTSRQIARWREERGDACAAAAAAAAAAAGGDASSVEPAELVTDELERQLGVERIINFKKGRGRTRAWYALAPL